MEKSVVKKRKKAPAKTFLQSVKEFHEFFDHPVQPHPIIPAPDRCNLRYKLLAEEVKELKMAYEINDIRAVADALCDIQYVLCGAVLEFGLEEKFAALFNEIHSSNMSKACATELEARSTVMYWEEQDKNEPCYYEQKGDLWMVYRKSDNKAMKSIYYRPAQLQTILNS